MDLRAVFEKRFGDLVALLRVDPGNDAAQDLALTAAAAAVAEHSIVVESGVDRGLAGEELTLAGRMRARGIDLLRVGAGATPDELLRVARSLSHDTTPVPSTASVRVEMVPSIVPDGLALLGNGAFTPARGEADRRSWQDRRQWRPERWQGAERRSQERRARGERRARLLRGYEAEVGRLQDALARAVARSAWVEALESAHTLFRYAGRVPAIERRGFMIGVRRQLSRNALGAFVELALRDPAEQARAADVLRWAGLDGADAMVDAVRASRQARRFVHYLLAAMPDAFPAVLPLLSSSEPHEIAHAATILGQMGRPEAIEPIKRQLAHPDPAVRRAVLLALANFPLGDIAEVLAGALAHPSADTRAAAAEAIGRAHATALAMPLVAALAIERDDATWSAVIRALGSLGSSEACAALVAVALTRRRILGGGYAVPRRVEAVRALASMAAEYRVSGLERVMREGDEPVRRAAAAALAREARAAG